MVTQQVATSPTTVTHAALRLHVYGARSVPYLSRTPIPACQPISSDLGGSATPKSLCVARIFQRFFRRYSLKHSVHACHLNDKEGGYFSASMTQTH